MDFIEIIVGGEPMYFENSRIVDTEFCVMSENGCFPHPEWTDSTYPLLLMWAEKYMQNSGKQKSKDILYFMNGSYNIRFRIENDRLSMNGFDDVKNGHEIWSGSCSITSFKQSLIRALKTVKSIVSLTSPECQFETDVRDSVDLYLRWLNSSTKVIPHRPRRL